MSLWHALIRKHEAQRPLLDSLLNYSLLNCSINRATFGVEQDASCLKNTSTLWKYLEIKAKTSAKVTSAKGMATSGDSSVIGCCVIPYHSQGALKFDLEINFKAFSKFSPPLKKDPLAYLSVSVASRGYQSGQTCKRRKQMHALASAPEAWTLDKY